MVASIASKFHDLPREHRYGHDSLTTNFLIVLHISIPIVDSIEAALAEEGSQLQIAHCPIRNSFGSDI